MQPLTARQRQILDFIRQTQDETGTAPSLRDIARHFRFRSMTAARDHVRALCHKGALVKQPRVARALQVLAPTGRPRSRVVDIPLYGGIPAGFSQDREADPQGCISVDIDTLGISPNPRTFALQVQGDSMIGRHILDGDYVVCVHGLTPRPGSIVAALIDNESTLKTFVKERGRAFLKAENPKYPKLIPAEELVIQGVVVAVLRRLRPQ